MRNLGVAGKRAATFTLRNTEKAVVGLARYTATDHIGRGRGITIIPGMGFVENLTFILVQFIAGILGCIVAGGIAFLMIAYGMPLLIKFIF